jgi:molybdopterin-guanine dinucleotide biosynthesis protein A
VNGDHLFPEALFPEALCSVYTPHALPHFQAARALGLYSPVRILTQADCLLITPQDPSSLVNVNAPVD